MILLFSSVNPALHSTYRVVRIDFIKRLLFMELLVRGEGMPTFGQRVKKAWKNINEIKPKKDEK
jgi:hypothetical protein